jgi:hypothetical protein
LVVYQLALDCCSDDHFAMGLFRRLRQRWQRRELLVSDEEDNSDTSLHQTKGSHLSDASVAPLVPAAPLPVQSTAATSLKPELDSMAIAGHGTEQIPKLLHKLQTAHTTGCDQAARTLRQLFALSEYGSTTAIQRNGSTKTEPAARMEEIRREMIADGTLVPALLRFLERCRTESLQLRSDTTALGAAVHSHAAQTLSSSAQLSLALLILNNVSIPVANKRSVALDSGGMMCLCRLLCDDPSCRIVVIVLVNLTFCDATLRRDLIYAPDIHLFSALSFAFRLASMTLAEYNARKHLWSTSHGKGWDSSRGHRNASERLAALQRWEEKSIGDEIALWPATREQMFPDTARWCVCAMQNLTRPGPDIMTNPACFTLIHTGIVPHLLRCLDVGGIASAPMSPRSQTDNSFSSSTNTDRSTPEPSEPDHRRSVQAPNHPSTWVKETAQDAALLLL